MSEKANLCDEGRDLATQPTETLRAASETDAGVASLLPCPFCGGSVEVDGFPNGESDAGYIYQIQCDSDSCNVNPATWHNVEVTVMAAWNARADSHDALVAERDAQGIAQAATLAGIIDGTMSLTGPQLLLLCDDLAAAALAKTEDTNTSVQDKAWDAVAAAMKQGRETERKRIQTTVENLRRSYDEPFHVGYNHAIDDALLAIDNYPSLDTKPDTNTSASDGAA